MHRLISRGFVTAALAVIPVSAALALPAGLLADPRNPSMPARGVSVYRLSDHPDANSAPPGYGLRLDGLFNGMAGAGTFATTTFSFDTFGDVTLTVNQVGSNYNISIAGTVFGGVDTGVGYGFGAGSYTLAFDYTVNVDPMGTGWFVSSPSDGANNGTLTAGAGIAGIAAGTVFNFYESNSMANPFKFLQDDHRLSTAAGGSANYPQAGQDLWVGRGWMTFNPDGSPMSGAGGTGFQDWLFTGTIVPLPTPVSLAGAGLLGLVGMRRRR